VVAVGALAKVVLLVDGAVVPAPTAVLEGVPPDSDGVNVWVTGAEMEEITLLEVVTVPAVVSAVDPICVDVWRIDVAVVTRARLGFCPGNVRTGNGIPF
jgi:hypothetical protein